MDRVIAAQVYMRICELGSLSAAALATAEWAAANAGRSHSPQLPALQPFCQSDLAV